MARQYQVPGTGYVNETGIRQYLLPGSGYLNDTTSSGTTVSIGHVALAFSGGPSHANEMDSITRAVLSFLGKVSHANEIDTISHVGMSFTGAPSHANEVDSIGHAALSFAGRNLTVLGASIVSIAHAVMGFTGNALHGFLQAMKALYLNIWSMWTGNPKSRNM